MDPRPLTVTGRFIRLTAPTIPSNLNYESSGTKQLMVLLRGYSHGNIMKAEVLPSLTNLMSIFIPDIITELLDLFLHPELNPNNAQILFSTQSHEISAEQN